MTTKNRMVEVKENLSIEEFENSFLNNEKPVILKNSINLWPALNWSYEELRRKAGHNKVFVRRNTSDDQYKNGKKYNIELMTFSEYVSNIEKGNKKAFSSYLAVQNVRKALPELECDIQIPKYIKKLHGGPFLWFAMKGHYEFCHFDPDDNFLIVLSGRKRVRLYPACYLENLYPNPLGSRGKTIQSNVDCSCPSLDIHPKFSAAKCCECYVEAGDILYFPAFWWHQVTSLETTVSINIFFGNEGTNTYTTKIMNSPQYHSFKYWLLNVIEQNRHHQQFTKVLQYLPESLSNFLLKQWHEIPDEGQLEAIVKVVLDYLELDNLPEKTFFTKHPPPLKIRGLLWR